jgi:hypothetical protein
LGADVAQRIVSVGVTIGTGLVMAETFVIQVVSLAMTGVSSALHAFGVSGAVLDKFDHGIDVINAQMEMMGLVASCMGSWAHGSSITAIPGNAQAAGATDMAVGEITDRVQGRLEQAMEDNNDKDAADAMGYIGNMRDIVDGFASNPDMYQQDARGAWSGMASSVGSCMSDGLESYGRITLNDPE